jgi:chloramphenicol 3-O phosphotransferase
MTHIYRILTILAILPTFILGIDSMEHHYSKSGTIIILNGPSASGKSSIQNELQKKFKPLYLKVGIDSFFDALIAEPNLSSFAETKEMSQYANNGELIRRVRIIKDAEGNQIVPLEIGPAGDRIMSGMHYSIAAYANRGNNLIVDYILYKPEYLPDLVEALQSNRVYFIGIKAPLAILEERERKRGTSPIGHARSHYNTVHKDMIYDLELDVSETNPEQSAQKIIDFIDKNPHPTALRSILINLSKADS